MQEPAKVVLAHRLDPEDQARADFYALLARFFNAPPDVELLAAIAAADELPVVDASDAGRELARAWHTLIGASAAMDAGAAADEYQVLFIGVGKSEVSLHASHYVGSMAGSALVDLRATLARLGLARRSGVNVYEDHLAATCEVMRLLIAGDASRDVEAFSFAEQRNFFEAHVNPWVFVCCDAIKLCPIANYYRRVAEFVELFMAIERDSFAVE